MATFNCLSGLLQVVRGKLCLVLSVDANLVVVDLGLVPQVSAHDVGLLLDYRDRALFAAVQYRRLYFADSGKRGRTARLRCGPHAVHSS